MQNPQVNNSKKDKSIGIRFGDDETVNIISGINATFDVDLETNEIVGIEVVDFLEQSKCKDFPTAESQAQVDGYNLHITYDKEFDALYIGLHKVSALGTRTIEGKCTVKSSTEANVVSIVFEY